MDSSGSAGDGDRDDVVTKCPSKGGKFLKKLWCCVGGSITR